MNKYTKDNKPSIKPEARKRIREFVRGVEKLQKQYGVEICAQDDFIALRDRRRKDDWLGFGEWDAFIFEAAYGYRMRARNIEFEEFESWLL